MWILLILVAIALVAVFLFISSMNQSDGAEAMTEIQAPDNSIGKAVRRLYVKAYLYGNCIYHGGLKAYEVKECS